MWSGFRRPKRRISIRIDMTPMVDIAFLLLIFYMVSTVFAMPQAMEINLPPADQEQEVDEAGGQGEAQGCAGHESQPYQHQRFQAAKPVAQPASHRLQ